MRITTTVIVLAASLLLAWTALSGLVAVFEPIAKVLGGAA